MMLRYVVSHCGTAICHITDSNDDFWWFWTAFYTVMVATDKPVFLDNAFSATETCINVHIYFVCGLLMGFKDFCYVSCTFSVLVSLYCTLHIFEPGINQ